MFKYVLLICLSSSPLLTRVSAEGITIQHYPSSSVFRGSQQTISWTVPSGVILATTQVDIYQNSQYQQTLGLINSQATNYLWTVSHTARLGNNYAIRVTGTSTQGKTAWATTPLFSIVSQSNHLTSTNIGVIVFMTMLLICLCGCVYRKRRPFPMSRQTGTNDYYTMNPPPVAQQVDSHYGRQVNPTVVRPANNGYSGSNVVGAALAGVVGGVVLDQAFSGHHGHHRGHYRRDDFGTGVFGGGGGDHGGNFTGGDNNDTGGGF